jgi:hypothetical protein
MPELKPLKYELLDVRIEDGRLHLRYRDRDRTLAGRLRRAGLYLVQGLACCGTAYGSPPPYWYHLPSREQETQR